LFFYRILIVGVAYLYATLRESWKASGDIYLGQNKKATSGVPEVAKDCDERKTVLLKTCC